MSTDLDPADWISFRRQAHRMLDDMLHHLEHIGERPVWQPIPDAVRESFRSPIPRQPGDLAAAHQTFLKDVLPYSNGNAHPSFFGWVQGGGAPVGMLAEMLAAGMNSNLGGRDHMPLEVERQILSWMRQLFGFPETASGLFVTGASMANLLAMVVARDVARDVASAAALTAYASTAVHSCIAKAMHVLGLPADSLRLIPTDRSHRINIAELERTLDADRQNGFTPFLIIGSAGTVDIGAIDDLTALADLSEKQNIWFHVDGAYAALAILSPELAPLLKGIERADSLAFDFHKWGQVPYSAGFLLVRQANLHRQSFAASAAYLQRESRGLAAGTDWPCDFGIDLSRSFQALKTWFTLKVYGTDALGSVILETCRLARHLETKITATSDLELLAPVQLNIVCFRFRSPDADRLNKQIVIQLQESGQAAPSTTIINGRLAIRVAIVNHRTTQRDLDRLIESALTLGRSLEIWQPRQMREIELKNLEDQLAAHPHDLELRLNRAILLGELGDTQQARDDYLAVLAANPAHKTALNNLGTLLYGTGYRSAARTAFAEAVALYPTDVESLVNLANVLVEEGALAHAHDHYATALQLQPVGSFAAHQGMARVLAEHGDPEGAESHRQAGYTGNSLASLPYRGEKRPVDLLLLVSAEGGNIPLRHLLDDRIFQTHVLTAEYFAQTEPLPFHTVIFNSIGDADLAQRALIAAESIIARTKSPVINQPGAVALTGRAENARRLSGLPGVVTPLTALLPRDLLTSANAAADLLRQGFHFPLLLRTPGFHTGRHFVKVDDATALAASLDTLPGQQILVIQYLDARAPDGKSRKYRAMFIDGQILPLHAAISSHWKIHYFTAEMADNQAHRAEDAAFLENMSGALGAIAMTALARIQNVLALDYAGIDFALNEKGEVLLFETYAAMVVLRPEPQPEWTYRWPAVERIQSAVRDMAIRRARLAYPIDIGSTPEASF